MLLKDFPVGSVVRCVAWGGDKLIPHYVPTEITVKEEVNKYFIDTEGMKWDEFDCLKDDFEIVSPVPEPRIAFTVGGQKFYVGKQVWSDYNYPSAPLGVALEVIGPFNGLVVTRAENTSLVAHMSISNISTTPPAPNERKHGDWEWKRGDWALHKDGRKAFVCYTCQPYGRFTPVSLMVSFATEAAIALPASEFTFIGHTEEPE